MADGYTGTVIVNAQNVKLTQQTPATQLNNVSIVTRAEGNSNLWIEGLNIANTEDKSIIKFQGADNYLTVKGTNTLNNRNTAYQRVTVYDGNGSHYEYQYRGVSAAISIGGGLKVIGNGSLAVQGSYFGAGIGGSRYSTVGDLTIGDNVTITATNVIYGAAIGSGYHGNMGNILIGGNANITATGLIFGAAIGGSASGNVGDISIGDNATVNVSSTNSSPGIGSGAGSTGGSGTYHNSSAGNILIGGNATVTSTSIAGGAGIGSGSVHSIVGNISIGGNANVTATSFYGAGIGCGSFGGSGNNPSFVGDITISSSATVNAQSNRASAIGAGYDGSSVGTISNGLTTFDITLDLGIVAQVEPQAKLETSTITVDTTRTEEVLGNPLRIQSGTTADDFINVFIEDMRTKALGAGKLFDTSGNLINASDIAQYNALSNDTTKQAEWLATLKAADGKTLDDVSLTTRDNAIVAIRIIDGAIDYALKQATSLGAMDNRLCYTADNIVNGK